MADSRDVLHGFREHLVGLGIVRKEGQAGTAPPMFLELERGNASPGDEDLKAAERTSDIIATAKIGGEPAPSAGGGFQLTTTVDVTFRTVKDRSWRAFELSAAIRAEMLESPMGYRPEWIMGGVPVITSRPLGGCQPLGRAPGQGYEHLSKYLIETYATP